MLHVTYLSGFVFGSVLSMVDITLPASSCSRPLLKRPERRAGLEDSSVLVGFSGFSVKIFILPNTSLKIKETFS